ncbi:AfsR/SARP family transcriptional regulator [Amycolatopsis jiangsuensis]|uniref:DNA-binding SARP family transcriptional activator/DNA polymerase III delta prime subunit n=1 Tax=Amycolatopsis jiangsuensis TaxID=1181879 RepID=A0A840IMV6_9PSEU|nr:BTAD domain-containing putative transcriptional regulator [Amycolatopsis jiangsuensis]MBB4682899.1 DNA-binding SARP family transcriptional activator/DNA polymerase III delta prime subunit [Amycolatopsis jiangsuensis]
MTGTRTPGFGVLGPLSAVVGGAPAPLGSAKTRIALATLLLGANHVVSVEELIDRLWNGEPPRGARNAAQAYVMRLRNVLGEAGVLIRTQPPGYLLAITPDMLDLGRFHARVGAAERARAAADPAAEATELRAALALWRGTPLADVPSELIQAQEATRLAEERLRAWERLVDLELELGRHAEVIGTLHTLTEENRLRERFWAQLMLALDRSGRQADALAVYRRVTVLLRDELGLDPGEALRRLHQEILLNDGGTDASGKAAGWTAPFQLPADVADFVGRTGLLAAIRELVTRPGRNRLAVPVVVLAGPPGVGKTALATHAGHELRGEFPDGVLHVNLRGYSTSPPLAATDALARFLRALGIAAERIPHEIDEQSALLRSLLSGRRVLMVLDNAASPEHVRPLLPSDPSCAVLITSRDELRGLVALDGARRLPVGVVSAQEARAMVGNIVGAERVAAEPGAAGAFAAACGYLPLGLRIASTNLAGAASRSIAEYVARLRPGAKLDAMEIEGDDQAAVRLAFDVSYSTVKPALSQFFRTLSAIPGPDFDDLAAAAVTGTEPAAAHRMLDRLAATNLIGAGAPGRFHFHDLIKEFAAERARDQDPAGEREAAPARLAGWYRQRTYTACRLLYPDAHLLGAAPDGPPPWPDAAAALDWLETEAENLVALVCARPAGVAVWELAYALLPYLQRSRQDSLWQSAFTAALTAAQHAGDRPGQAAIHRALSRMQFHHARYSESETHMLEAARLFRESGDPVGEARAHTGLGSIYGELGRLDESIVHLEQSLRLGGDTAGRSTTLFDLGMTRIHLGRVREASANLEQAQELARRQGLPHLQLRCAGAFAFRDLWAGRLRSAAYAFGEALDGWAQLQFSPGVTEIVRNLAETCVEAGLPVLARDLGGRTLAWAQAAETVWLVIGSHVVLGDAALAGDDLYAAMRHFTQAQALSGGAAYWAPAIDRGLAAGHRRSGELSEAAAIATRGLAEALPRDRGRAHAELSAVLLAQGDPAGASTHAGLAEALAEEYGYRLDRARAQRAAAAAHRAAGDTASAADQQKRAAAVVDAVRAEADPMLRKVVARVPPRDAA